MQQQRLRRTGLSKGLNLRQLIRHQAGKMNKNAAMPESRRKKKAAELGRLNYLAFFTATQSQDFF